MLAVENRNNLPKYLDELDEFYFSKLEVINKIGLSKLTSNRDKFEYAKILRMCGKFKESETIFKEIQISSIPDGYLYQYYNDFGFLYLEWGKLNLAKKMFLKSVKLLNSTTDAFIFLAEIYSKKESIQKAINILESSLAREGDLDEVYYNLGAKFATIGMYEEALEALIKCESINAEYPNLLILKEDLKHSLKVKSS